MKKNILFIVGSLRKESFNKQIAHKVEEIIGDRANISYLEYADVPFMNQDIEFPSPMPVSKMRDTVASADGVWVFTPEYNHSYPAIIKNLFDWLSRPLVAGNYNAPLAITNKKMTISGAGGRGAMGSREQLTNLLSFLKVALMPNNQTGIALNKEAWTEGRLILTDKQMEELSNQATAFINYLD